MALRDTGRMNEAIAQFERVVRQSPAMAAAHLNLALTLSLVGRMAEATEHYRTARRLNPAIPELPGY
jgi:Flp pilus assembly protein TadD